MIQQSSLPVWLCLGAPKSGTTSLFEILNQHPLIFIPPEKEIHYFDRQENFNKGPEWYKNKFAGARKEQIPGEITPSYLYNDDIPKRIHELLGGNVKFIIFLRQPAERAYSEYLMFYRNGYINESSFSEAIANEMKVHAGLGAGEHPPAHISYIYRGLYAYHINKFLQFFPKDQFFICTFENDFIKNKEITFRKLFNFLGLPEVAVDLNKKSNEASVPAIRLIHSLLFKPNKLKDFFRKVIPTVVLRKKIRLGLASFNSKKGVKPEKLDPRVRKEITEKYFKEDIRQIEQLTGKDLNYWLE